jgi:serine/threonine-protein kinase
MDDDAIKRIGDYEILGVLGTGGMGRVYKVRNTLSDRVEAMKILLPDLAGRQELAERFLREIKLVAALDHPNIAALRTALTVNNQLIMIMEYVEGQTLASRLEQGPLPVSDAVNYIDQALLALGYAHQRQVIHRDIKPSNMMLTPQGVVKLMDFGIARSAGDRTLTMTGTTLGSLYYMSPEQVKGSNVDARSDLYSVGVSLYEMVTGQCPFQADSDYSILAAHIQQTPKPPIELRRDLPSALNDIILMAMEKDPARRFQSAESMRTALNSVRSSLGMPAAQAAPVTLSAVFTPPGSASDAAISPLGSVPPVPQQPGLPPVGHYADGATGSTSHRGLWMGLGAFVVLAVLVAAGLYIPHRSKAKAGEQVSPIAQATDASQAPARSASEASAPTQGTNAGISAPIEPSNAPAQQAGGLSAGPSPSANSAITTLAAEKKRDEGTAAANPSPNPAPRTPKRASTGSEVTQAPQSGATQSMDSGAASAIQAEQAAAAAQWEDLEKQFDQISTRANAVSSSLDTLQRQQASQGLNLRGDIAASQERLRTYVGKAQAAIQNQDPKNAQKYLNLAEPELERIEKFLGH